MSDDELISQVTGNARGLTSQALNIAKEEMLKRGIEQRFSDALDAQNRPHTPEEIDHYCELITNLNCPVCGKGASRLNGTLAAEVVSFILVTQYKRKIHVACPDCLDSLNNEALIKTIVTGWWGIPWGIIRSIQAVILNIKSKRSNRIDSPNSFLRSFVIENIGRLEAYKNDKSALKDIISQKRE